MGLTVSAARMSDDGSWLLLSDEDEAFCRFGQCFEKFSSLGFLLDSDVRSAGMDRKKVVDELVRYCGDKQWLTPLETEALFEVIVAENFDKSSYEIDRLSLTVFLHECVQSGLGVVLL